MVDWWILSFLLLNSQKTRLFPFLDSFSPHVLRTYWTKWYWESQNQIKHYSYPSKHIQSVQEKKQDTNSNILIQGKMLCHRNRNTRAIVIGIQRNVELFLSAVLEHDTNLNQVYLTRNYHAVLKTGNQGTQLSMLQDSELVLRQPGCWQRFLFKPDNHSFSPEFKTLSFSLRLISWVFNGPHEISVEWIRFSVCPLNIHFSAAWFSSVDIIPPKNIVFNYMSFNSKTFLVSLVTFQHIRKFIWDKVVMWYLGIAFNLYCSIELWLLLSYKKL